VKIYVKLIEHFTKMKLERFLDKLLIYDQNVQHNTGHDSINLGIHYLCFTAMKNRFKN
jgi:hypothetical protein